MLVALAGRFLRYSRIKIKNGKPLGITDFIGDDKRLHGERNLSYSGITKYKVQYTAGYTNYFRSGRRNYGKNELMYVSATISAMIRQQ
jgi:hypothetical protein